MSGGSMDYAFRHLDEMAHQVRGKSPERRALREHLTKLALVVKAVEWDDSGDTDGDAEPLIRKLLGDGAVLREAIVQAKAALAELQAEITRAEARP